MGWKAIKDHYQITHFVTQDRQGRICIGGPYTHNLIIIDHEKKSLASSYPGAPVHEGLKRYWDEMQKDLEALWEFAASRDSFTADLPVFTCEDGQVLEFKCEAYGWPNVTHDGQMMYENMFFSDRATAIEHGKQEEKASIKLWQKSIQRLKSELKRAEQGKAQSEASLAAYEALEAT